MSDARLTSHEGCGGATGTAGRRGGVGRRGDAGGRWRLALVAGAVLVACGLAVWWQGAQRASAQASEGRALCRALLADLDATVPASGPAAERDPASLPVAELEGVQVAGRISGTGVPLDLPVAALGEDAGLVPALEGDAGGRLVVRVPAWLADEAGLDALAPGDRLAFVQVNGARRSFSVADGGTTSAEFDDDYDLLVYWRGALGEKDWVGCSQSS